jgi:hypothetical protein
MQLSQSHVKGLKGGADNHGVPRLMADLRWRGQPPGGWKARIFGLCTRIFNSQYEKKRAWSTIASVSSLVGNPNYRNGSQPLL